MVDRPLEAGSGQRVAGRVEGDLVAAPDQGVRDETDDELGAAIGVRWDALIGRRELGDSQSEVPCSGDWRPGGGAVGADGSSPCYPRPAMTPGTHPSAAAPGTRLSVRP
jgi:hypothetical protein